MPRGPSAAGCSMIEGPHALVNRLLVGTRCSPALASAIVDLRLGLWNDAARVRNGGSPRLPTTDWYISQQQVDQANALDWPNPVPELPSVPRSTAETFTFAYQPTAAAQAAAMQILQLQQPPSAAQAQHTAVGVSASTAQPEPVLYEEQLDAADTSLPARDAALSLIPDDQLMALSGTTIAVVLTYASMCRQLLT